MFWVIALLVPRIGAGKAVAIKAELRAFVDPQVLLAMGITVFGPAAFFTSITYIAPMMAEEAGFSDIGVAWLMVSGWLLVTGWAAVSPINLYSVHCS
ncbi:hypothetical protein [Ochrobactrum sp. BTU1]|uniref:hypothetical protein n=1 Tax=Ochrobactrum sp. BTU1 TaxID=2840456 RepID=UPI001C05A6D6|nr:hypothetical protein KMS41_19730 [Ochrobactrum sp. BTU1]